ncbi:amidohydrolase family protein [Leucobacter soli]|uniref:amidohydrolase family protein n=1 Tax=Leucobacter soli TaxID=2812850 RepID=UPI0036123C80
MVNGGSVRSAEAARAAGSPEPAGSAVVGVSPHAPYSLDGEVIRELARAARERGMRIHSHVGESSVEASLYAHGNRDVLAIYGDMRDEFALIRSGGTGLSTARYAESIELLGADSHLAHGIYLDRADRDLLRDTGTRVALCPRSNRVIGLDAPPVADYLREGHEIAVGTDSLSSSPSLDLLGDAAALAELARSQGYAGDDLHQRLVEAVTRGGAGVLGRDDLGELRAGLRADLAVFDVPLDDVQAGDCSPERALVERGEDPARSP